MTKLKNNYPKKLPLITLTETVIFPHGVTSIYINDSRSKQIIEKAFLKDRLLFLSCLEDPATDANKVFRHGCVAFVLRKKEMENGKLKILVQGLARAFIENCSKQIVDLKYFEEQGLDDLTREEIKTFSEIKKSVKTLSESKDSLLHQVHLVLDNVEDPARYSDMLISSLGLNMKTLQKCLEAKSLSQRIKLCKNLIDKQVEALSLREKINKLVQGDDTLISLLEKDVNNVSDEDQEILRLKKRLKGLIKKPITPQVPDKLKPQSMFPGQDLKKEEIRELKIKLSEKELPKQARKEALKQILRLEKMHSESSEASILRNYLDWVFDLPWTETSKDSLDIKKSEEILDEDHLGLLKAKERILEFLAVYQLKPSNMQGAILCFAGPPGVGKTSLGKSIAQSLGRSYYRISLGGVSDEAEIRGHRRTYVGSMPGKILQAFKACKTKNPVIVLDEIDKLISHGKGDPAAALLEVLDPQQNKFFKDHYLNLDFDLSQALFIATANMAHNIPPALKDRLEIISISGYTSEEKKEIAKKHLIEREITDSGLPLNHVKFTDEALDTLIRSYTKEAGLRNLKRQLASVCRKAAKKYVKGNKDKMILHKKELEDLLGAAPFYSEEHQKISEIGVATGLAWTEVGGEILKVETIPVPSKKAGFILTGKLGDVMKESAQAAFSFVKSYIVKEGLSFDENFLEKHEIHVHLPGGAIPKDGPSAGVALSSALLSLIVGRPLKNTVAMTGEITLSGRVLPVGGIKEKVLAAYNNEIFKVLIPYHNKKDLEDIPDVVKKKMEFVLVSDLAQVFKEVLEEDGEVIEACKEEGSQDFAA